ncbi:hypothetical protein HD806DRAFT_532257 [Xylariaceae sp. AK1471]|nr:hypothetical protein HD806DRAFT_532257 [Xylariaceae sp. AK1471]
MDDKARQRKQEQPGSSASNPGYSVHDPNAQSRSYGAGALDWYLPAPLTTSPSAARGMGDATSYSGYYQDLAAAFLRTTPQTTIAYQPEHRQYGRQTQGYRAYNTSMPYNVPQAGTQCAVYDTSQQHPPRQSASLQMMPADVTARYFPSEPTNAAAAAGLQPQTGSSNTSAVYQHGPADQRVMLQSYPSSVVSMSGMALTSAPEQVVEAPDYAASAETGEAYEQYQTALREIFTNIQNGVLQTASESLLSVSEWLLSKVAELGLAGDEENLHADRIKLWRDFNHAWLSLCQKQKEMLEYGAHPQRGQSLVSEEGLRKMGQEIVRLCNGVEQHGLVDYEYGVWEELIIDILEQCLDLYENGGEEASSSLANPSGTGHSSHRASR